MQLVSVMAAPGDAATPAWMGLTTGNTGASIHKIGETLRLQRTAIVLEALTSDSNRTVLVLAHDNPLAIGIADSGVDYLCPGCSRIVLQRVYLRQFISLVIHCMRCGALGGTPPRECGEPIPAASVVAPVGQYLLGSQLTMPGPGMFAARDAAEDYAFDVGASYSARARAHMATFPTGISPAELRQMAALGRTLLGDRFEHFNSIYNRSQKHPTSAATQHRLIELIRYREKAANQIESAGCRREVEVVRPNVASHTRCSPTSSR
jgi:hypothetical protein